MKLRIHGHSVRFRLRKSDVEQLDSAGRIEATLRIAPGAALTYRLVVNDAEAVAASFRECVLEVTVPRSVQREWAVSEEVAITAQQDSLLILIEKDFQCLHKDESAEDTYPNPMLQVN